MNPPTINSPLEERRPYLWHEGVTYFFDQLCPDAPLAPQSILCHHPDSKKTFLLIQEKHPFHVMQKFLQALHAGLHPLVLDPELDFESTRAFWNLQIGPSKDFHSPCAASFWLATSGSSAHPKLIGHHILNAQVSWQILKAQLPCVPKTWGLALPTHHMGGLMILLRQYFEKNQVVSGHYENIIQHIPLPDAISLVATQLMRLSNIDRLNQFKFILLGGAQCPLELVARAKKDKWPLILGYGSTETCSAVSLLDLREDLSQVHLGKRLQDVHFSIQDNGRLEITSPTLHQEMIEDAQFKFLEGPLLTQDCVCLTADGHYLFQGRWDDIFICGGENISPGQIEHSLPLDPLLSQVALIPRPHPQLLEAGHLVLFLQNPLQSFSDIPKLMRHFERTLIQTLPKLQRPLSLSLHDPLTSLKVPRKGLKNQIQERFQALQLEPVLIFIHGLFGHPEDFDEIQSLLIQKFDPLSMVAITLPGHERANEKNSSGSIHDKKQFLQNLHHKIQKSAEGRRVILIGYSLGGRVAMELACTYSTHYQRICLISSHLGLIDSSERSQRLMHDQELAQQFDPINLFLDQWYQQPLFSSVHSHPLFSQRRKRQEFADLNRLKQFFLLTSLAHQPAFDEKMKDIDCLYLYGELDSKFKALSSRFEKIGAKTHSIANAGHALLLEDPHEVAKCLIHWI